MKKGIFMRMAVILFLLLLPSLVLAQDSGNPDTVRFNSRNLPAYRGFASIPVYFTADEPVSNPNDSLVAIGLPFKWYPLSEDCQTFFFLDSVSWVNSEPPIRNGQHMVNINNQNHYVIITTLFSDLGPTQNGTACELWFSYPPEESCTNVIDTTFYPPSYWLDFVMKDARWFIPQFVKGKFHLSNDPGIPDTVRLDGGELPAWTGRAKIPVRFTTDEWLA